ncbi:MAG: DUF2007 domain-containing protein [Candidatus Caldatribacteriota bacterium]|jgi:hypothetical protein|nr:DUF2007 domain-containing protein [Atribacterota bacterium]MDD4288833.1 DUF2007 domain-containing protein [Atribacterota bacterium]MDD4765142.1 DUF2007 domain-containing protein [Atribacterota bacterium]
MENNDYKNSKIIELCRVPTEVDALPIQSLLESYGIRCILQSDVTRSVHPFTVDGLAEVRILISDKDLGKAKEILKESDCSFFDEE